MKVAPYYKKVAGTIMALGAMLLGGFVCPKATIADFIVPAGTTFNVNSGTLSVTGDLDIDGTVTVTTGKVSVTENFDNGGVFNAGTGEVEMTNVNTATIFGTNTFYDFTSTVAGKTLVFPASVDTIIGGTLDLQGASMNELVLKSDTPGTRFQILVNGGVQSASFLDIIDTEVQGTAGNDIVCSGCIDSGNTDTEEASPRWLLDGILNGIVFNSVSNEILAGAIVSLYKLDGTLAVAGTDILSSDDNPYTANSLGVYGFTPVPGTYYVRVSNTDYTYPSFLTVFPSGRTIATGSKGEQFTVVNSDEIAMDQPMDPFGILLRIQKDANKKEVKVGEVVTYSITIENTNAFDVNNVFIRDVIPPGFKYIKNRVILDGAPITDPSGNRPLIFSVNTIPANTTKVLKYQLVVGSGVTVGNYENKAMAEFSDGRVISNTSAEVVEVVLDPLFDLGTAIGKVFFDRNENGVQDPPTYIPEEGITVYEDPVPNVTIAMEDGTLITTDANGRFSIPALTPGRHLFRLDERSLPEGAYLTTDKVVVVDVTEGLLLKVNFGVNLELDKYKSQDQMFFVTKVKVSQDKSKPSPRLNAALFGGELVTYQDVLFKNAEFRIFTNYAPFIEYWTLEITDSDTKKIIKKFDGDRGTIFDPIIWDGRDAAGQPLFMDGNYEFTLYVTGIDNRIDETKPVKLKLRKLTTENETAEYEKVYETKRAAYREWADQEDTKSNFLDQNILVEGETIHIDRLNTNLQSVRVVKGGKLITEVPVSAVTGLTAREVLEGKAKYNDVHGKPMEIILPRGDYELLMQEEGDKAMAVGEEGDVVDVSQLSPQEIALIADTVGTDVKTYSKPLTIGEDYLFFVGMGDSEIGYKFTTGNIEPIAHDDEFKGGFYNEGKLAYYLKGKVKGKYLITSSYDSDRERKELFKNLDPEEYYPIYGDQSEVDYDATNTQGNLYLLVEWDKSSLQWGNYSIAFGDTEFAQYSRTLYGGKVDFESLSTTQFGDPKTKVVAFRARAQQKPAHIEYLATGGSLYYTRHQDVTEGSEKVKVEVRDRVTGLVLSEREMVEGTDYDFDYKTGRLLFWQPVPILVQAYSIISNELLQGNLVYVTVEYEYDVKDKFDEDNTGARVQQAIGENVIVGGTYVNENQPQENYKLRGTDVTINVNKDTKIVAEYAESESDIQGAFVSTDGGLSFTELSTSDDAFGKAYGIKGDSRLFNRMGVEAYYKYVENDFSTAATSAQQGKSIYGWKIAYDLKDSEAVKTSLLARYDYQALIEGGNAQSKAQVGATSTATTLLQLVHQTRRLRLTAEFQRNEVERRDAAFDTQTNDSTNTVAVQADYKLHEKVDLKVRQQLTLDGEDNDQTTLGVTTRPTEKLTLGAEKTLGQKGVATNINAKLETNGILSFTGQYSVARDREGNISLDESTNAGVKADGTINDNTTINTSLGANDLLKDGRKTTMTVGAAAQLNETTELKTSIGVSELFKNSRATTVTFGGTSKLDEETEMSSEVAVTNVGESQARSVTLGGKSRVDEKTTSYSAFTLTDSNVADPSRQFTFGSTRQITDEIQLVTGRTFGQGTEKLSGGDQYQLVREKDGKTLTGSLTRAYSENPAEVSRSNIYGLSGDINDRWALQGSYERGEVQNLDGTQTDRSVLSTGIGYARTDPETGARLQSSTKAELRFDDGAVDRRQWLFYQSIEGQVTPALSLYTKLEFSKTQNITSDENEARHRELVLGGAYRPIMHDRLNLLGRYTYLENKGPDSQENIANIEERIAQVFAAEAIYELTDKWQLSEKFAFRILDEKVEGFDFTKTHTWLMIHRLNYKFDENWKLGGEFRTLAQQEAQDVKRGFLIEGARSLGEFAQLGVGYNFTDFDDDLTNVSYTSHGPFVRFTGKLYDRTPEEIERAKQQWVDEKIKRWAWMMVEEELSYSNSPILDELNQYFDMADSAHKSGRYEEASQIYRDVIMAGEMMYEEAAEYIRSRIEKEKNLQDMMRQADQYYRDGQYEKAKKILEKILVEAEHAVLE